MSRVSRLGIFKALKVQEDSLLENEVRRCSQEEFLRALSINGKPSYLDGRELLVKPRRSKMCLWIGGGILKKKIWDFSLLHSSPEASKKVWSISWME